MNAIDGQLISKVLFLDDAQAELERLRSFCADYGIVGTRPQRADVDSVMALLRSNVDLGGIMIYENFGGDGRGIELARLIHETRPELPLFLRRNSQATLVGLSQREAARFRCAYTLNELDVLRQSLESSIFSRIYPNALVRGITEFTRTGLENLFKHCEVDVETPYLVKDRIIFGEVFTLIAIESGWCRGYMMLQGAEAPLLRLIAPLLPAQATAGFRELNNLLGEATNLIWGAFKNRYADEATAPRAGLVTQVPIVINHDRHYISFGSDDPQLCLKYTLTPRETPDAEPVPVYQRFVFNLSWSPDDFRENASVESLVSSGELELF